MLRVLLILTGIVFAAFWGKVLLDVARRRRQAPPEAPRTRPSIYEIVTGFVTDFLDTLGISSFALTTSLYKLRASVLPRSGETISDRLIPGTLNAGHSVPTVVQALIYISFVQVEQLTLLTMIGAAVAGAYLGAGVVARWPKRHIQIGMGVALTIAAGIFVAQQLDMLGHGDGHALSLHGPRLAAGVLGIFVLGALMSLGIGLYAPCIILVTLLGMDIKAAFPIMMGSCAFLMPMAGARFIQKDAYSPSASLGLTIGGTPAVLVAAWWVKELEKRHLRLLIIAVVLYAAYAMLRSAWQESRRRT